jgi:Spy/CpxP family protein refolding chaperone
MKRWWVWVVLLLSLGINAGILATLAAQRLRGPERPPVPAPAPAPGPDLGPAPSFEHLADRLRLDGEARGRFLEIQRRTFETLRAERQNLQAARIALRRELLADRPDRQRVEALLDDTGAAQSALERTLVSSLLDSRALLDAEQQQLYMRFVEDRLRPRWRRATGGRCASASSSASAPESAPGCVIHSRPP